MEADLTGQNYYDLIVQKAEIINDKKNNFENGELLKDVFTLMKAYSSIYEIPIDRNAVGMYISGAGRFFPVCPLVLEPIRGLGFHI